MKLALFILWSFSFTMPTKQATMNTSCDSSTVSLCCRDTVEVYYQRQSPHWIQFREQAIWAIVRMEAMPVLYARYSANPGDRITLVLPDSLPLGYFWSVRVRNNIGASCPRYFWR